MNNGPFIILDFLTVVEETRLLEQIDNNTWIPNRDKSRRVQISGPYHDASYKMISGKFSQHPYFTYVHK
jgi:hypothetical protein